MFGMMSMASGCPRVPRVPMSMGGGQWRVGVLVFRVFRCQWGVGVLVVPRGPSWSLVVRPRVPVQVLVSESHCFSEEV